MINRKKIGNRTLTCITQHTRSHLSTSRHCSSYKDTALKQDVWDNWSVITDQERQRTEVNRRHWGWHEHWWLWDRGTRPPISGPEDTVCHECLPFFEETSQVVFILSSSGGRWRDTTRPRHITYVLVWSKSDQRWLRKTLHKQTNKETDTTKIMVTWLWAKKQL